MKTAFQLARSIVFIIQMYVVMVVLAIIYLPWTLINKDGGFHAVHAYCNYVRWSARILIGLKTEVRGTVPVGETLVASKHQSFLDIILITSVCPRPKFIMKKQLQYVPIIGWYGRCLGCVPVDRGKRGAAIQAMLKSVKSGRTPGGQLIIFPQGTRVAPGVYKPYKVGVGALYSELGQTCVPTATNVGVFWARHSLMRKPGVAVIEFLDPIDPGIGKSEFMQKIESMIEPASDALMAEAGFDANAKELS